MNIFEKFYRSLCFSTRAHEGLDTNFSKVSSRRMSKVRSLLLRNSIEACISVRECTKALIQISQKSALAGCQKSDEYLGEILSKSAFQYARAHEGLDTNFSKVSSHRLSKIRLLLNLTRSNECRATGWRRPIRCLKLQVIFRKRATNYRALLRKIMCKDKASYGSSPPCIYENSRSHRQELSMRIKWT